LHAVLGHGILGHRVLRRRRVPLHAVLGHRLLLHAVLAHLVLGKGCRSESEAEREGSSRNSERDAGANGHDLSSLRGLVLQATIAASTFDGCVAAIVTAETKKFTVDGFLPPLPGFSSANTTQFRPRRACYFAHAHPVGLGRCAPQQIAPALSGPTIGLEKVPDQ